VLPGPNSFRWFTPLDSGCNRTEGHTFTLLQKKQGTKKYRYACPTCPQKCAGWKRDRNHGIEEQGNSGEHGRQNVSVVFAWVKSGYAGGRAHCHLQQYFVIRWGAPEGNQQKQRRKLNPTHSSGRHKKPSNSLSVPSGERKRRGNGANVPASCPDRQHGNRTIAAWWKSVLNWTRQVLDSPGPGFFFQLYVPVTREIEYVFIGRRPCRPASSQPWLSLKQTSKIPGGGHECAILETNTAQAPAVRSAVRV